VRIFEKEEMTRRKKKEERKRKTNKQTDKQANKQNDSYLLLRLSLLRHHRALV
jgi:hypothetical protein